jgi:peptide/histidine transporter 3/4
MTDSGKTNKLFSVCLFILVVEACERLCYYTIFNSMVFYLEDAGCDFADIPKDAKTHSCNSASTAFALRSSFRMLAYVMPIFGGYIADNVLGRYKTILYFTIVYVIGVALMALGSVPALMSKTMGYLLYLFGSFVFTAVGTGAIKPNVVNFGADQYDTSDPVEAMQQKSYFSYFYMVINIGSIFSAIWTVSLATSRVSKDSAGSGFMVSFTIAAVCMFLALMCFLAGTPKYSAESKAKATSIPMIGVMFGHLTTAAKQDSRGHASLIGLALIPVYFFVTLAGSLLQSF